MLKSGNRKGVIKRYSNFLGEEQSNGNHSLSVIYCQMVDIQYLESELRELAGLLSDPDIAAANREKIRHRLHSLASRAGRAESPFLTLTAAARRYGIAVKEFRSLVDCGEVKAVVIAGRRRIDVRQFPAEFFTR